MLRLLLSMMVQKMELQPLQMNMHLHIQALLKWSIRRMVVMVKLSMPAFAMRQACIIRLWTRMTG